MIVVVVGEFGVGEPPQDMTDLSQKMAKGSTNLACLCKQIFTNLKLIFNRQFYEGAADTEAQFQKI